MNKRWILNAALFLAVIALAIFTLSNNEVDTIESKRITVSDLKLSTFNEINIYFPSRATTSFILGDYGWKMNKPYNARADELYVYRILALLATTSSVKLKAENLDKFGLDNPALRVVFSNNSLKEEFIFGTYNPVTEDQYILYRGNIFLVSGGFSETASFVAEELIDKKAVASYEKVKQYDLSRLEQWQESRLKINHLNNSWSLVGSKAEIKQDEADEWFGMTWSNPESITVEPYKMDPRIGYKSFDMALEDGKKITFYRIQEHPQLKLYRNDEKLLYSYPSDLGFTMLNPPITPLAD